MWNDDGEQILEFAEAHDLMVANTYFKKQPSHLIMYKSRNDITQIDYWLLWKTDLHLITNSKVIPLNPMAPQHQLLIMDACININQWQVPRTTGPPKIKWWQISVAKRELSDTIAGLAIDPNQPANDMWNHVMDQLQEAASSVLGMMKPGKKFIDKQPWFWNKEVQQAVRDKKLALKKWWTT